MTKNTTTKETTMTATKKAPVKRTPKPKHATREAWLHALIEAIRPWYKEAGSPLPKAVRISVGFSSKGARSNRIGECWAPAADEHGLSQIFVHPSLSDAGTVASVVVHELIHAAVGCDKAHGPAFRKPALALGLEGRMTATVPGADLVARLKPVLKELGTYPHGALKGGTSSGPKKQTTRMLKCECPECGYIARTTSKWIEDVGAPICPADYVPMEVAP
jgi:hypothetical protein